MQSLPLDGEARISVATSMSDAIASGIDRLLPQLSSSAEPDRELLQRVIDSEASHLFVAEGEDGTVLGVLVFAIPTGTRAWIEDVVVDVDARGQRLGKRLTEEAIGAARQLGAKTVDLTSRPSREAANALYASVGFERRETNVYRFEL